MSIKSILTRLTAAGATLLAISACQQAPTVLSDADAQAFASQVDDTVTNMLTGLNNDDRTQYTRDFDSAMLSASDEEAFAQVYDGIIGVLGAYQSRTLTKVQDQAGFRSVYYDATFENEDHVTMWVVFAIGDEEHKVSGLWFDSPMLRGQ